ncbi:hypothetical protein GF373_17335 [bacterium]|nr:hypothetical protein [bacterium]
MRWLDETAIMDATSGKRVAVVGNAGRMVGDGLEYGEEIDGFDTVIRFNRALPIPGNLKRMLGGRVTIWAGCEFSYGGWCLSGKPEIWWRWERIPHRVRLRRDCKARGIPAFAASWKSLDKLRVFDYLGIAELSKMPKYPPRGGRPSSGARVVHLLTEYGDPKELILYGFDFFRSHSWPTGGRAGNAHSGGLEYEYMVRNLGFREVKPLVYEWR